MQTIEARLTRLQDPDAPREDPADGERQRASPSFSSASSPRAASFGRGSRQEQDQDADMSESYSHAVVILSSAPPCEGPAELVPDMGAPFPQE